MSLVFSVISILFHVDYAQLSKYGAFSLWLVYMPDKFSWIVLHSIFQTKCAVTTVSRKKKNNGVNRRKKPLNEKPIIVFLFAITLVLSLFLGGLLFALARLNIPDIRSVAHYRPPQTSLIYDRNGTIIDKIFTENRTVVALDEMHPLLPKAFVAAEDGRFFEHPGLDSYSVLRALFNNLREGRKSQGGSTITQQVAKGLLLTPEKTYLRKFKEAILAYRIDTLLSKDEIIYIYLNQIYLGDGAYGVEAAAQKYFNKRASQLSLAEVAILAGLPQAPSRYSPLQHWDRARVRQRYVLNRMAADGYISEEQARQAYADLPQLAKSRSRDRQASGYYLQEVRKRAEQMLGVSLQTAGVKIFTNLDLDMQQTAHEALVGGIERLVQRAGKKGSKRVAAPEGAIVCLDVCSGRVRALVGGSDYSKTQFNRAVQARRPAGSVFKPLVYSAALERGWSPMSSVVDEPFTIRGADGKPWQPQNFGRVYHGNTTLREALVHSYNIPAIKVLQQVGIRPVHELAKASGISSDLPADLSLALGSADVSPLEMTGAYIPFSCEGAAIQPTFIDRITTVSNKELYRHDKKPLRVLNSDSAKTMKSMLAAVISEGSGRKANGLSGINGGKTGTSDNNRDAWFIGFHNHLLAGVWVGHDQNQSLGNSENGGSTAAPIWFSFMKKLDR
jgi:penicillin-binding protein 1A